MVKKKVIWVFLPVLKNLAFLIAGNLVYFSLFAAGRE